MARISNKRVEEEIHKYHGNLSACARGLGRSRSWLYLHLESNPKLWDAVHEARETMLDNAESVLYKKVLAGSTPELLFFLKTQGKKRGYIERQQLEHSGDQKVRIVVEYADIEGDTSEAAPAAASGYQRGEAVQRPELRAQVGQDGAAQDADNASGA